MSKRCLAFLSLLTLGAAPPERSAPAAAKTIAHRIHSGTLDDATAAIAEAYAWAGVSIQDDKGVAKGITPTIGVTMRSFEMRKAAIAARAEPTTSLADLAKLLEDLSGFEKPAEAGEDFASLMASGKEITPEDLERFTAAAEKMGQDVAKQLEAAQSAIDGESSALIFVEILGEMIRASRTEPQSPHNFVPLLLEALAKERDARDAGGRALDLASGEADPHDVVLTLSEAELFLLMFRRRATSHAALPVRYASLGMPILAAPGTACSDLLDNVDDYTKSALPHAADHMGGEAATAFYDRFKKYTGRAISEELQLAIGYGSKALRLMKWLMDTTEFEITPTPKDVHYAHDATEVDVTFKAEVKLPPAGDSASSEAANCLNTFFGFNIPDSPQVLAKQMKDWRVYWDFSKLGGHGSVSSKNTFQYHTQMGNGLKVSGTTGTSEVIVGIAQEQPKADLRGAQKKGTMRMTASLDRSASFDPTLLFKTAKSTQSATAAKTTGMGVAIFADVVADVLIEWAKKSFPPQAKTTATVTWHEPKVFGWEGTITQVLKMSGERDITQETEGRAPPALAVGNTITAPGPGVELFHDEGSASRTMTVKLRGGREGDRIHDYVYDSKDHARTTRKETTPEVCTIQNGAKWSSGLWTADSLQTIDIAMKGKGYTTVTVTFSDDGTYLIDAPIPYAGAWVESSYSYLGKSSCDGALDPENRPLTKTRIFKTFGPFRLSASGKAKADAKVLSGSLKEEIKPDGHLGTQGTVTTTWNIKKVEVK